MFRVFLRVGSRQIPGTDFAQCQSEEAENLGGGIGLDKDKRSGYSLCSMLAGGGLQEGFQSRHSAIEVGAVVFLGERDDYRHAVSRRRIAFLSAAVGFGGISIRSKTFFAAW